MGAGRALCNELCGENTILYCRRVARLCCPFSFLAYSETIDALRWRDPLAAAVKAETGWIAAALVAALGVFGVGSQQAGKPGVDKAATAPERARTARPSGSSAFDRGPCGELEKTIQTFLLASEEGMAAPASCYGADPASSAASVAGGKDDAASAMRARSGSLRYVIAILPDPLHTHFSLTFDRLAESIQQGFQDEGYFFDSSWMPWEKDDHAPGVDEDPAATDAREDQPGVLLFRKRPPVQAAAGMDVTADQPYREGLAVLVVGEEPTTGIHKRQFNNALAWIGALEPREGGAAARPKQGVSILGPSFSGSLPSLAPAAGGQRGADEGDERAGWKAGDLQRRHLQPQVGELVYAPAADPRSGQLSQL